MKVHLILENKMHTRNIILDQTIIMPPHHTVVDGQQQQFY